MTAAVLVVHPDPNERKRIGEAARRQGYALCEADSGVGGMILAREAAPDLVVLAIDPGDPEGFVGLRLIRSQLGDRARVVAIGLEEPSLRQLAVDLGATRALADLGDGSVLRELLEPVPIPSSPRAATISSLP
jgi:DNA-binding response OmpR family regulator